MIHKIKTENRDEWKALRKQYIGGSDAAAVVGLNPFTSMFSLWAEKTGNVPEFGGNLATEVGTCLEEFVARKFSEVTGKTVRRCNLSLVNDEYPFAIANVDRIIVGEDAGLEIKTTSELNTMRFKDGDYPGNYYCQCVHYLAVTGKSRWYLAVLIGNREFKTFVIERDEAEINALMDAEQYFWETYVKTMTPPPADGHRATTEAIRSIYPEDDGDAVDLSDIEAEFALRKRLKTTLKDVENEIDEIENRIKLKIGEASKGTAGLYTATWKTQTRNTLDAEALKSDYPDIDFSKYTKSTQSRVFRITEQKPKKS